MGSKEVDGRAERYRHVRPELLERLIAHIAAHGLHGLTMRSLAAGAGVSHPTLLHHFASREVLLAEVAQQVRERLARAADAAAVPESIEDLEHWWRNLRTYERPMEFLLIIELYLDAVRRSESDPSIIKEALHDPIENFARLFSGRGRTPAAAVELATAVVAAARGLQLDLLASGDHERVDAAFSRILRALVDSAE